MAFTRRHYIQIAAMLAWERIKLERLAETRDAEYREGALVAIESIEGNLAGMFRDDNPHFDAERFHTAAHDLGAREVTS